MVSNRSSKPNGLEVCVTKRRSLTSGGPNAKKEQCLRFKIIVCFVEVSHSVLGVVCLEFFRVKSLDV